MLNGFEGIRACSSPSRWILGRGVVDGLVVGLMTRTLKALNVSVPGLPDYTVSSSVR